MQDISEISGYFLLMAKLKDIQGGYMRTPSRWFADTGIKGKRMRDLLQWLVMNANLCDGEWNGIPVKRGQIITSLAAMSEGVGQSMRQTRDTLDGIVSGKEATKITTKTYTLLTICNYDCYVGLSFSNDKADGKELTKPAAKTAAKIRQSERQQNKDIIEIKDDNNSISSSPRTREIEDDGEKAKEREWRSDFGIYQAECERAYRQLIANPQWIAERQKFNPNVDIRLTMEKVFTEYWYTEAGWKRKKASRTATIDWSRTFINSISMSSNKVYNTRATKAYTPMSELQQNKQYKDWDDEH